MINACRTTRIYCREGCPPGRRTKPENRVTFASVEEARAAGYRPCKVCLPDDGPGPWRSKAKRDIVATKLSSACSVHRALM